MMLTDEQIIAIADSTKTAESGSCGYILPISFARAIEAEVRKQDEALIRQMLESLEDAHYIAEHHQNTDFRVQVIDAANARLFATS